MNSDEFSDEEIDAFYRSLNMERPPGETWTNDEDGYYDELANGTWCPSGIVHTNWRHEWGGPFLLGDVYQEAVTLEDIPKIVRRANGSKE